MTPEVSIKVKPLSVNECYTGKRFKTEKYREYEKKLMFFLPTLILPDPPYKINYIFGFSSRASDLDNAVKNLQDIISKKYDFNDKLIFEINVRKQIVKKGNEFFCFKIDHFNEDTSRN